MAGSCQSNNHGELCLKLISRISAETQHLLAKNSAKKLYVFPGALWNLLSSQQLLVWFWCPPTLLEYGFEGCLDLANARVFLHGVCNEMLASLLRQSCGSGSNFFWSDMCCCIVLLLRKCSSILRKGT